MRKRTHNRLKLREWMFAFLGLLILGCALILPQTASAISLKETSVVEKDLITLGDIFSGLDTQADKILGAAPQPGNDMTLNARTLMRIAIAMDLPWRPATTQDQVVIRRAATLVDRAMIEQTIKNELALRDLPGQHSIAFTGLVESIVLPQSQTAAIEIVSLNVTPDGDQFEAELAAPSKENPVKKITVKGRLERMIDVPVLTSTLQSGHIINANDLEMISMAVNKANEDVILKTEDLIGMTPRRMAAAGKPLKRVDIQAPQIVDRGELVTLIFSASGLSLTAQGKALQAGAKGDTIRVVNASSSKTIQGTITGTKEVTVESF
jgi:flagella basal body P-ring formation protein FlgA